MEHITDKGMYLDKYRWDVDKYQSKYPPEHWNLCRLFMLANQTQYPEARLVQLTEEFYNRRVHGRCSDLKADRMVAALSVPVMEYVLHCQPGAFKHPFQREATKEAIDSGKEIQPRNGSKTSEHSTEKDNSKPPDKEEKAMPAEKKPESSSLSLNSQENKQDSLERNERLAESRPSLSKDSQHIPVAKQQSTKQEGRLSAEKRAFTELEAESDKSQVSGDQKPGVSESKRQRTKSPDEKPRDSKSSVRAGSYYRLKKLIDRDEMKRVLMGFVIIRDVAEDSTFNNGLAVLQDSFRRSMFGPCTWYSEKIDEGKGIIRIKLESGHNVLVEAEGQYEEYVKLKMAETFLTQMARVAPDIKANYKYYNNGHTRQLPDEMPKGPCKLFLATYSYNRLRNMIDAFAQKKPFWEMIVLLHSNDCRNCSVDPEGFCLQDVIDFIKKERADKLRYRLAKFDHRRWSHQAICISYSHNGGDLLEWLDKNQDERYCVISPANKGSVKGDFGRPVKQVQSNTTSEKERKSNGRKDQSSLNKNGEVLKDHSRSTPKNSSLDTKSSSIDSHEDNAANKTVSQPQASTGEGSLVGNPSTKDVRVEPTPKNPQTIGQISDNASRKDGLSWVGKEHLSKLSKSLYLVKFVKEDSTTERNPFNLLNSTCSLAYNVDIKFAMKQSLDKTWHVLVVLKHDQGNILVGEAKGANCSEARLTAAQNAVNTIQSTCRVVEPNFNYFAEGGVPRFISLKNPLKTATYEIIIIDTIKNPLNQEVVNLLLQMFIEDKTTEDLFFLASDYTSEERELIRKAAIQNNLGWRLFGQRSRAATPDDMVSTQHVCVFRPKTAVELVQQLIVSGGSTDKYSVTTKYQKTDVEEVVEVVESPVAVETPVTRDPEPKQICNDERFPGGCFNPKCSLAHINFLDSVVNQFFGIRL